MLAQAVVLYMTGIQQVSGLNISLGTGCSD
jgi:hypothetical protein